MEWITHKFIKNMEPAAVLGISLGLCLVAMTGFSIYTAFGPPAKELRDPFEEHED